MKPPICPTYNTGTLMILFFLTFIWIPTVAILFGWGKLQILEENRKLAPWPNLRSNPLTSIPKQFDDYLNDNIPFRDRLVHCYATVNHRYLKLRSKKILLGKDGWLFFDQDNIQSDDFMGRAPLSEQELIAWKDFLERRQSYLAAKGIHYLFVIAPNKITIYPEMLPDYYAKRKGQTRREQLTEYLNKHRSVSVLDPSQPIREGKSLGTVYHRADSHWNGRGCSIAYKSICTRLQEWFPDIQTAPLEKEWKLQEAPAPHGLWGMMGLSVTSLPPEVLLTRQDPSTVSQKLSSLPSNWSEMGTPSWSPPVATKKEGVQRRLLVLGDSFFGAGYLQPSNSNPLAEFFGYCFFQNGNGPLRNSHLQLQYLIDQERPDVVIEETVERHLKWPPAPQAMAPDSTILNESVASSQSDPEK